MRDGWNYPTRQVNGLEITEEMRINYLDLVITKLSLEQQQAYDYVIQREKKKILFLMNQTRRKIYCHRWTTTSFKYYISTSRIR